MRRLLGILFFLMAVTAFAYDLPAMRNLNGLNLFFRPDAKGTKVVFTFEKQDMNGYSGTDAIVFTVISPSGKTAWEGACPDDGDEGTAWKKGPRQQVRVEFDAVEEGIYRMSCNTASHDIHLLFDRATVKNAAWGFSASSYRFSGGARFTGYLLLPPRMLGEEQEQMLQLCTHAHSRVKGISITSPGGVKLVDNLTPPHGEKMAYHEIALKRSSEGCIYKMEAEQFSNVVSMILPKYGEYMIFPEERSAHLFANEYPMAGSSLELKSPAVYKPCAFGAKRGYQVTFLPADGATPFDFKAVLFGQSLHFTNEKPSIIVNVPGTDDFQAVDLSGAAEGRMVFVLASEAAPAPLAPAPGSLLDKPASLVWSAVPKCGGYKVDFTNVNTGETFSVKRAALQNRLNTEELSSRLTPGVWRWSVSADGRRGNEAFFIVPQQKLTRLAYIHGFYPVRDGKVDLAPEQVACSIGILPVDEIDFQRSFALVNGNRFPMEKVSPSRIACGGKSACKQGRNQVKIVVFDRSGARSEAEWGFFLGEAPKAPVFTHDERGNIFCNGTPFFPVIYYGYMSAKLPIERCGFNVILGNTLASKGALDKALRRNMKILDSGSVFKGIYSKPKSAEAAERDVAKAAANGSLQHQGRMGAWMDEMDVHRSEDYIRHFLAQYGEAANGWRGVCSCNKARHVSMANMSDYLMIDHYGVGKGIFSQDVATIEGRGAAGKKPLLSLVMGFSRSNPKLTGFIPGPVDVEYAAFVTLREKANGLGLYQCGEYRLEVFKENWAQACNVYERLAALCFAAYGKDVPELIGVKASGGRIRYRAMQVENMLYLLVQNSSFTPAIGEIAVKNTDEKEIRVLFEDRVIPLKNGAFTDAFAAESTHVYSIILK